MVSVVPWGEQRAGKKTNIRLSEQSTSKMHEKPTKATSNYTPKQNTTSPLKSTRSPDEFTNPKPEDISEQVVTGACNTGGNIYGCELYFEAVLDDWGKSKSFPELMQKCSNLEFGEILGKQTFLKKPLQIDEEALKIYPTRHLPTDGLIARPTNPVRIRADGDCLPGVGSLYAFGTDEHPMEIRARIVRELVCEKDYYLNESNMKRGLQGASGKLLNSFAIYSEEYEPGTRLNQGKIEEIYKKEVMAMTKPKEYMGIWQIMALSSCLKMPILSIYPQLGNPMVRLDLNRLVLPRISASNPEREVLRVFWTSTRNDMFQETWIPNHFVAALPKAC